MPSRFESKPVPALTVRNAPCGACGPAERASGSEVSQVKVDAFKIREIARKLGVSERTVEEYLLDKLTMVDEGERPGEGYARPQGGSAVVDRFGRPLEEDAG